MENSNKTTGMIIGVVAFLVIGGGVLWAVNNKKDDSTNTADTKTNQSQPAQQAAKASSDIVAVASNTSSLSTLVTAVKAASLVDTLQGAGPYTVFAPTNDAFAALPAGTLDTLLKPENVDQLKSILTYHVVAGKVRSSDLKDGQVITTVQGGKLTVKIADGKVYLIDAKGSQIMVEKADVNADNGIVHIVGGVLLPS